MATKVLPPPPPAPAGASQTEALYTSRTADRLGVADKIYRDAFVKAYMIDFDGPTAMFRIGHTNEKTARSRAYQLLREPYVLEQLHTLVKQMQPQDIVTRQQVMAHMWDLANNSESDKSRVAATAHVGKMLGMFKEEGGGQAQTLGVMLIPAASPEEWAQASEIAQATLKARAAQHT